MTNSKVHAILGELYKLLSTYSQADFEDASRYSGLQKPLRRALQALSDEVGVENGSDSKRRIRLHDPLLSTGEGGSLLHLLRSSPHFSNARSLASYARSIGVRVSANPKDGKERIAKRLATAIENLPESRRSQIRSELISSRGSQTQGWIEVIKGNGG